MNCEGTLIDGTTIQASTDGACGAVTGSTGGTQRWVTSIDCEGFDLRLPPRSRASPPKASVPRTPRRSILWIERLSKFAPLNSGRFAAA
jgi:hypothetical protein